MEQKQRKKFGIMSMIKEDDPEKYARLKSDYHGKSLAFLKCHYPEFFKEGRATLPSVLYNEFGKRAYKNSSHNYKLEITPISGCKVIDMYGPDGLRTPGADFGPVPSKKERNYWDDEGFTVVPSCKPMKLTK